MAKACDVYGGLLYVIFYLIYDMIIWYESNKSFTLGSIMHSKKKKMQLLYQT